MEINHPDLFIILIYFKQTNSIQYVNSWNVIVILMWPKKILMFQIMNCFFFTCQMCSVICCVNLHPIDLCGFHGFFFLFFFSHVLLFRDVVFLVDCLSSVNLSSDAWCKVIQFRLSGHCLDVWKLACCFKVGLLLKSECWDLFLFFFLFLFAQNREHFLFKM